MFFPLKILQYYLINRLKIQFPEMKLTTTPKSAFLPKPLQDRKIQDVYLEFFSAIK